MLVEESVAGASQYDFVHSVTKPPGTVPPEELEFSLPARRLEGSMLVEELEFSVPEPRRARGTGRRLSEDLSMPLQELEFFLPAPIPSEEFEFSMLDRRLKESMPLGEFEFSMAVRHLEGSMPIEELGFSMPERRRRNMAGRRPIKYFLSIHTT